MVSQTADGRYRFRVYLPHASRVDLVGIFTDWRRAPIAMEGRGGWWEVVVELPRGEQEFCYVVDSSVWLADYAAHGVTLNGAAGWVSRVMVNPGAAAAAA